MNADLEWEDCGCPLCGAAAGEREAAYHFPESTYHRCLGCGLVYLSPRLSEACMLDLYQDATYYAGDQSLGYETYEEDEAVYRLTFARRLREIKRFRPGGRVLDVGCGTGLFLEEALADGWDAFGLDVSRYAVSTRAPKLAVRVESGTLESAQYPPSSFDVVTMFDFFEHIYRPKEFVERIAHILAPGGIAVVATPNYDSLMRRLLGRRTVSFKIPEHVTYYTKATLGRAVSHCFDVAYVEAIGQYCTTGFLARRLSGVAAPAGSVFRLGVRVLGLSGWTPYVPSGSLLAVLTKR